MRAWLRHIAKNGIDDAGRSVLPRVAYDLDYVSLVLDPEFAPFEEALRVAQAMRESDRKFFWNFQSLADDENLKYEQFLRALMLMENVASSHILATWLRGFVDHPVDAIRSKAAKKLCECMLNFATIERLLQSRDARVRANAVEALWAAEDEEASSILLQAVADSSHRVVANALVGLCKRGIESAFRKLIALTSHQSPMFRSAAAWGLGELSSPQGIPVLKQLATKDRAHAVRVCALRSLESLEPRSNHS